MEVLSSVLGSLLLLYQLSQKGHICLSSHHNQSWLLDTLESYISKSVSFQKYFYQVVWQDCKHLLLSPLSLTIDDKKKSNSLDVEPVKFIRCWHQISLLSVIQGGVQFNIFMVCSRNELHGFSLNFFIYLDN